MNIQITQLLGQMIGIFKTFVLISYSKLEEVSSGKKGINNVNRRKKNKRYVTLRRVTQLIIASYIIKKVEYKTYEQNISKKDGYIKITEGRIKIKTFILVKSGIVIKNQTEESKTETILILKTNVLGILVKILSNDWILTIVSWELFNKSQYQLVSLRSESESTLAASLKYFVLSALSTTFLLMGVFQLYKLTGSTHYEIIETNLLHLERKGENVFYIEKAFILIYMTFLFKVSGAPFYQWAPDLYENLENQITNWKIIIPKISVQTLMLVLADNFSKFFANEKILLLLLISGTLSLIVGSFALNSQWLKKRFFAYSGISHIGFILLAFYCKDLQSKIFYTKIYTITTINIFTIKKVLSDFQGRDLKKIKDISGKFKLNPALGIAFAINLFSLAGVCQLKIL